MALNTFKRNCLTPQHFKGLSQLADVLGVAFVVLFRSEYTTHNVHAPTARVEERTNWCQLISYNIVSCRFRLTLLTCWRNNLNPVSCPSIHALQQMTPSGIELQPICLPWAWACLYTSTPAEQSGFVNTAVYQGEPKLFLVHCGICGQRILSSLFLHEDNLMVVFVRLWLWVSFTYDAICEYLTCTKTDE